MKYYKDENGVIISENELMQEYEELRQAGDTEAETFSDYIRNCTDKSGTLERITFCSSCTN